MLHIKHFLTTLCAVLLFCCTTQAQQRNPAHFAAIENEKIAYITKELNLSTAEAQRFFPIYNQYSKEIWSIRRAKKGDESTSGTPRGGNGLNAGSRRDVIAYDAKEVDVKKNYRQKFSQVIGVSRASQFFQVEQDFTQLLYKELQSRKRNR